jgi:SAM-dependent methyltransferase
MAEAPIDAWTAYWRTGQAASCLCGATAEVQLSEVWRTFIRSFEPGARLIDLAAGNGAAVRMCASHARALGLDLQFHAVDAAEICPADVAAPHTSLTPINFSGGIRLESLPFPDATFDGALSQFGFEYADEAKAAGEVARILTTGGRLRLVMHAKDGAVDRDIGHRLERLDRVMAKDGPAGLVRTMARAAAVDDWKTVEGCSARLPAAAALLRQLVAWAPPDDAAVFYASAFLTDWTQRHRYRPTDLNRAIEAGWKTAMGVAERQRQMLHAARASNDVGTLRTRLESLGFHVTAPVEVADARGAQIAWLLDGVKG